MNAFRHNWGTLHIHLPHHDMPPTCYGDSCGLPNGEALQRIDTSRYYEGLWTKVQLQNTEF